MIFHWRFFFLKGKTWTPEEDKLLMQAIQRNDGKNWKEIARHVPGRSYTQCSQRWRRINNSPKSKWSKEEDKLLLELVNRNGRNWELISKYFEGKTAKQLKERFVNKLDPGINRSRFTAEEDDLIINLFVKLGPRWSEITQHFPGRPDNMVKNRFYSYIRKRIQDQNPELCKEPWDYELDNGSLLMESQSGVYDLPPIETENQTNNLTFNNEIQQTGKLLNKKSLEEMSAPPMLYMNIFNRSTEATASSSTNQNFPIDFSGERFRIELESGKQLESQTGSGQRAINEEEITQSQFHKSEIVFEFERSNHIENSTPRLNGMQTESFDENRGMNMMIKESEILTTPSPGKFEFFSPNLNFTPNYDKAGSHFQFPSDITLNQGGSYISINDVFLRRNDSRSLEDSQKSVDESMIINILKNQNLFDQEVLNKLQELDRTAAQSAFFDKIQLLEQKKQILESMLSRVKWELVNHTSSPQLSQISIHSDSKFI